MIRSMLRFALPLAAALLFPGACATPDSPDEARTVDFYNHNAQQLYDGGHYQEALFQFEKALGVNADDGTALLGRSWSRVLLAEAQILAGQPAGGENVQIAIEEFTALQKKRLGPNQFKVDLGLGKARALLGDLYRRRAEMNEAEGEKKMPSAARDQAIADARREMTTQYTQAEQLLLRVLADDKSPGARDNLTALITLAWLSVSRERYRDAILYSERYLEQVRRSKDMWLDSMQRLPEDRAVWELKLAGAVRKEVACRDLLASAMIQEKLFGPAEEELSHIILMDPDFGDAYLRRGIVRDELGRKQDALADFQAFLLRAARLDLPPEDPRVMEAVRRMNIVRKELGMEPAAPLAPAPEPGTEK